MNDEKTFAEVVEDIRSAETKVDKVLDAARLERHAGPPARLSAEQKYCLLLAGLGVLLVFGLLTFLGVTSAIRWLR